MKDVDARALAAHKASAPLLVAAFTRAGSAPSDELVASLTRIEKSHGERFGFVRLDMDREQALVDELRIHKVPELFVWKGGKLVGRMEGAMRVDELVSFLEHAATR